MHLRKRQAATLDVRWLATEQAMVLAVRADLILLGNRSRQALMATRQLRRQEIGAAHSSRAQRIERMLGVGELVLDVLRQHRRGALSLRPWLELGGGNP